MDCARNQWPIHSVSPLGVDYQYAYRCWDGTPEMESTSLLLLIPYIGLLFHLLAQTAENYMSPTLERIRKRFNLSLNVAGVTLLAFGNGAPDVFSLIASYSATADITESEEIGIGALLGSGVFVTTVVAGSVAVASPCTVCARTFTRNVTVYLIAVTLLSIIAAVQAVHFFLSSMLFVVYLIYVLIVINDPSDKEIPALSSKDQCDHDVFTDSDNDSTFACSSNRSEKMEMVALVTVVDNKYENNTNNNYNNNPNNIDDDDYRGPRDDEHTRKDKSSWLAYFQQCTASWKCCERPWYAKLMELVDLPFTLIRKLSIPTTDKHRWSKPFAVAHPIVAPPVLLFSCGFVPNSPQMQYLHFVSVCVSLVPACAAGVLLPSSHPPIGWLAVVWDLWGFIMSVAWIRIIAGELLTCLAAVADIFGLPPSVLGLTVLAWGNSVGDFFSNVAVARQGQAEMALAGCYGGPAFNMLVGLGVALTIVAIKHYPATHRIKFGTSDLMSIITLYLSLLASLGVNYFRNFVVDKAFGYGLIALYIMYTICQIILVTQDTIAEDRIPSNLQILPPKP